MDLQNIMQQLSAKEIDFDKQFSMVRKQEEGTLNKEEQDELRKQTEIIEKRLKEAEKSKTYINFFNYSTMKLIEKTPNDVLCELGLRAFTGSRDVPRDYTKAVGLVQAALN